MASSADHKRRSAARAAPELHKAVKDLARRVRALRGKRKLTQEQLAAAASLDPKHIQYIEAGRGNVTLATLVGIAKALDVPIRDLFRARE